MTHLESYIKMLTDAEIEYRVTHEGHLGGVQRTVVTITDPESEDSVSMEFDKTTGKLEWHQINIEGGSNGYQDV